MSDLISRQDAIDAVIKRDANCGIDSAEALKDLPSAQPDDHHKLNIAEYIHDFYPDVWRHAEKELELPSAEPTLYGYNIEHLVMIAKVMKKDNIPPQKVVEILSDVGRVAKMIYDEQAELIRKEVERWI